MVRHPSIALPEFLSDSIASYLGATWNAVEVHLDAVKTAAERYEALEYPRHSPAFTYLFFGANYAKSYVATSRLPTLPLHHLVDLAGGTGASVCGALAALRVAGARVDRITILDRSFAQLELFERISVPWIRREFPDVRLDVIEEDALAWLRQDCPADMYVASYVLCEQSEDRRGHFVEKLRRKREQGATTVVIDVFERASAYWLNAKMGRFLPEEIRIHLPFLSCVQARYLPKYHAPLASGARSGV